MNQTNTSRNKKGYAIATALLIVGILLTIAWINNCFNSVKEINYKQAYDSIKQQQDIDRKQIAYKQAQWEKEVTLSDQRDKKQQAKIIELEQRSRNQMVQYNQAIEKIKQEAPKPCEPYISQMVDECNKAIDAKNDVIEEVKASNDSLRNDIANYRAFIKEQSDYIKQDSISDAGKDAIAGYMDKKIKRLERKNKLAKFFNKVLVGTAVVATAVCVYVTSFK